MDDSFLASPHGLSLMNYNSLISYDLVTWLYSLGIRTQFKTALLTAGILFWFPPKDSLSRQPEIQFFDRKFMFLFAGNITKSYQINIFLSCKIVNNPTFLAGNIQEPNHRSQMIQSSYSVFSACCGRSFKAGTPMC